MLKQLPPHIRFDKDRNPPQMIWGFSKTVDRVTLNEDDVDADHLANVHLQTGQGIKRHSNPSIAQRNYADAGTRTYWESNRVYSACLNREWVIPGNEDERVRLQHQSKMQDQPIHKMLPLLRGSKAVKNLHWVRS